MMLQLQIGWNGVEMDQNGLTTALKFITSVNTVGLVWQIWRYHDGVSKQDCILRNFPQDQIRLWDRPSFKLFLAEAVVCGLHTPPWTHSFLPDSFGLVMLLRFYLLVRVLRDSNYVYNHGELWKQSDPNQVYQFQMSPLYFLKAAFWELSWIAVLLMVSVFFLATVYAFYILAREEVPYIYDMDTSFEFMAHTMTTVGGDIYTPSTFWPRTWAMIGALLAMFTVAALSAVLARFIELRYAEQVALGWCWRETNEVKRRVAAVELLQISWRLHLKGQLKWAYRRRMENVEFLAFTMALARFQELRICHLESMVQGEGGYKLVMERIGEAQQHIHDTMEQLEARMDDCADTMMRNVVYQLTKMEDMQGVVLSSNFDTLHKYFTHVDKKMRGVVRAHGGRVSL
eukprot:TRINITY_DN11018_c0_g1_i7.p1 TRINITY_DN11018_c0_g1~~TRINITY_DN11018_c0_g1_i7.p1  ORF type:complete len:400 (-),score=121.95 TRINITY_DN11018_c0_g1_i7:441-1640(-)